MIIREATPAPVPAACASPRGPAYGRFGEVAMPPLVVQGDLDFPHIQHPKRTLAIRGVIPTALATDSHVIPPVRRL